MSFELTLENESKVNGTHMADSKLHVKPGVDMQRLIGKPHLFGRYFETREGFVIIPVGIMTMQPDGRITGYANPNEGSWAPYIHGTVTSDKAFAFISAHNKWIPSSTWQQSLGNMPFGFFCDEPESPQKLILVPQETSTDNSRIVYLVASCLKFYERTVPELVKELFAEGIEPERIKVVVNGCNDNYDKTINGISYAFSTHNAWEYSALYEAPLRWDFEYGMLIHDTNRIMPGFRRKVESFNRHLQWDHLPATPLARCLLGLYSHNFLQRLNPWLQSVDGIDKNNGVIAEASGELLMRAKMALAIGDPEHSGGAQQAQWRDVVDVFNTGSPRVRRVFPSINLHKFIHIHATDPKGL